MPDYTTLSLNELHVMERSSSLPDSEWAAVVAELARRASPTYDRRSTTLTPPVAAARPTAATDPVATRVRIVAVDMPFWDIVGLMVKWTLASIPAFLILAVIAFVGAGVLGALGIALTHR